MTSQNFSTLFHKFLDGDKLSDEQCITLLVQLTKVERSLIGLGDIFYASRMVASTNLSRIKSICDARGINSDPEQLTCPHCFKQLNIPEHARRNVETYQKTALLASACCRKPIRLYHSSSFGITPTNTSQSEDDWGLPFAN